MITNNFLVRLEKEDLDNLKLIKKAYRLPSKNATIKFALTSIAKPLKKDFK